MRSWHRFIYRIGIRQNPNHTKDNEACRHAVLAHFTHYTYGELGQLFNCIWHDSNPDYELITAHPYKKSKITSKPPKPMKKLPDVMVEQSVYLLNKEYENLEQADSFIEAVQLVNDAQTKRKPEQHGLVGLSQEVRNYVLAQKLSRGNVIERIAHQVPPHVKKECNNEVDWLLKEYHKRYPK